MENKKATGAKRKAKKKLSHSGSGNIKNTGQKKNNSGKGGAFSKNTVAPFKKKPRLITDSATGEVLDVAKRPKRTSKANAERKAATGSELAKAIQWFPGHMTKAIREINESLSKVDIAIELCDARIPISSRNPNIEKILNGKPYITLMNKSSLADQAKIAEWKRFFAQQGKTVIFTDCLTSTGICEIVPAIRQTLKEKLEAYAKKGMRRLPKAMILGVTNSGKSTLIKTIIRKRKSNL